ncbi:eIF-2-alpha kinase GCN2 isoform X1 [Arabidopsis lyrata subsp. lyrata]|uniref:eIF-2-alpha kinase GCN2 isoform X1 n=1 Tax=Arabidopsis lyrata subsp. lyrata TaxID=81972 RepID=UPI000A29DECB|nr:eIF-2-alpha kinase GCN2 isoform X1 [Arabidopsis lyrata subsp. lyrata]|eukprot:XP_020881013.1 eIF-2-alpha kinase GCN2 isoform X1 [Arabidopsis lyrata subsp. lyrata]
MGRSSSKKKKKRGGSGRRGQLKDHGSNADEDNELLSEEITALSAIFQEDCKIVSDSRSPPQIVIKLRPYSKDMGYEDIDISAMLVVRCLPGYPYKCPKLQITPEQGLTTADAEKLLSLLEDQANSNAREGRVMIFNLVEAAQEFLSEIIPESHDEEPVPCLTAHRSAQFIEQPMLSNKAKSCTGGPFVYGFIDLFSGLEDARNWSLTPDENRGIVSSVQSHPLDTSRILHEKSDKNLKRFVDHAKEEIALPAPTAKLNTVQEDNVDDTSISSFDSSKSTDDVESGLFQNEKKQESNLQDDTAEDDSSNSESESLGSWSSDSLSQDQVPQISKKDLLMVHLLRVACTSRGPLADALPQITDELHQLGILSEEALDLASKSSPDFNRTFEHAFNQNMVSTSVPQFWEPPSDSGEPNASLPSSRYLNDFEELKPLGQGGFGHVVLCKNKLDGRQYAVKKIRLKEKEIPVNSRIVREVATLSRLQHQHVVRYYQAWFETGVVDPFAGANWGSKTAGSSMFSYSGAVSTEIPEQDNNLESTYLYIQMEYCPRTLRQVFESYNHFDKDFAWHLIRQIVEGLAHIHGQGIIHRDFTPNNIFFDARNDIKIGDFGLAKFLKLEQLDQDGGFSTDVAGSGVDSTGQAGTYFYTAPEIEQDWPKIDEKADMYSLGVVFFELWHPFGTAMERHVILTDLKLKGELPLKWVNEFPEQASLLRRLMSPSPSDRPSATELLKHAFPPRMESELLDNILRIMQTSEDSSVYDRVVSVIFDEEVLEMKSHQSSSSRLCADDSYIQYTEINTELRDYVVDITKEVFRQHCAKHLEVIPMRLLSDCPQFSRKTVKLLTNGGDMLELCYELRLPFVNWISVNQKSSFKRYEISHVYRRAIGHSPPNPCLQADFDIVGGTPSLTEAEVLKVIVDITTHIFHRGSCDIHLNHGDLLDAIWSWAGIKAEHRRKVAELLSMMGSLRPQSSERKLKWVFIRRQLLQELKLPEAVVNRLQTVASRFCGDADQALPRLRGALRADRPTRKALDELSNLLTYLRVWRIEEHVHIDVLMPPTESYHRNLFFQVFLTKENSSGTSSDGVLLAVGGRYDFLVQEVCDREYKMNLPGAVGVSLALETIFQHLPMDLRPIRNEVSTSVLVCSRGGGGLLVQRMELVAELWEKSIKAEFVPTPDPSLTEQYEYANEHEIKCLVIIAESGVAQNQIEFVKVRHLELKKEKVVGREELVKFLLDAMAVQFRNPSVWS